MGKNINSTPERDATTGELAQYTAVNTAIEQLDVTNTYDISNDNHRLFFYSFDGTGNDREVPGEIFTNPAIIETLVPINNNDIYSNHEPGVATRNESLIDYYTEAITGEGSEERENLAYDRLVDEVHNWYAENPDIEVHVSTAGFSRGTGSQRHFANLVDEYGIPSPDGEGFLIEPGGVHQDVMLVYDSVVTGQEDTSI